MWDFIKEMFSNDGNNSRIFSMFEQLIANKQSEKSLLEFLLPIEELSMNFVNCSPSL
ncbi:hypothetical protein Goarm_006201 [Gossypium armourianum]|uniref:Uncharacterized protein n=1 Tax=Gossypium armourianum TaxID=34283 RepID=A0A7J9JHA1_9ROSI|nr:hypothetical protein [Gossypium armourianum]